MVKSRHAICNSLIYEDIQYKTRGTEAWNSTYEADKEYQDQLYDDFHGELTQHIASFRKGNTGKRKRKNKETEKKETEPHPVPQPAQRQKPPNTG